MMHKTILIGMLFALLFPATFGGADAGFVPFDRDKIILLLKKTMEMKFLPYRMEDEKGRVIVIKKLHELTMDWQNGNLYIQMVFEYRQKFLFWQVKKHGEIRVLGQGIFSAAEQKLGIKILQIEHFQMDSIFSGVILSRLAQKITGREIWPETPPSSYEILTGENLPELLRAAIAKFLPFSGESGDLKLALTALNKIEFLSEPGAVEIDFNFEGEYCLLAKIPFKGCMGVKTTVLVNPEELCGAMRIDSVTRLNFNRSVSLLDGLIQKWAAARLKGKIFEFSWK